MSARILVAGIGNVFFGDDGFGVEVVRRLRDHALPEGVVAADFGIRGIHLAYELLDPPELLVVADTASRGDAPGTLYVIEPERDGWTEAPRADAHGMDLRNVLSSVQALGGAAPRVLVVGCEPADMQERMGLSPVVAAAVDGAVSLILDILKRESTKAPPGAKEAAS